MYLDDSIYDFSCQLDEKRISYIHNEKKEVNPWELKKKQNEQLSSSYKRLKMFAKASRVSQCATFLEFRRYLLDNNLKLQKANFCKVRLCPMCAWRRSLKVYGQMSKVLENVDSNYDFRFLTLTCKNVYGKDLSSALDHLFKSFKRFTELKVIKDTFVGWFRALEVTYNKKTGQFHPHFHVVLCSNAKYYYEHYMEQNDFVLLWKQSLRVDYIPVVDIRMFDGKKGVAEASKYTVKTNDYILESETLTDKMVSVLDYALANRRLVAFGGLLKKIHSELNLGDPIDGDLNYTDSDEENAGEFIVETYGWHVGVKNYYKVNLK